MEIEPFVMFVYAVAWLMIGVSGTSIFHHFKLLKEQKDAVAGTCELCE